MMRFKTKTALSILTAGVILTAVLVPPGAASAFQTESVTPRESWVAWVKEAALPIGTLDWRAIDLEDLDALDRQLEGKRVVYLGEPDHYIREKYDFRLILIRFLFERGWHRIGMEMGRSDGIRADRYLETGDPLWLERMALYGYKGNRRTDRDDSLNISRVPRRQEFVDALVSEDKWFLGQLRAFNQGLAPEEERIRWFGYDVDPYPGGGYRDARDILEKHSGNQLADQILRELTWVEKETVAQEIERLKGVMGLIRDHHSGLARLLGEDVADDLLATVHCLVDSLTFLVPAKAGTRSPLWLSGLREREKTMFRQMDELLARLPSDEKIILMGHNLHLSKDYRTVRFGQLQMWPSVGSHVHSRLPGEVYSIWMLYDHGRHGNVSAQAFQYVPSHPRRIESLMSRAGGAYLLPLGSDDPRAAFLDEARGFVINGGQGSGLLRKSADALFFVSEVHEVGKRK